MKRFILQAVTEETHLAAVQQLITIPGLDQIIISAAFIDLLPKMYLFIS